MKKSTSRICLLLLSALHIAAFFVLPLGELRGGLASGLGSLAGALGLGEALPETLTGLSLVKQAMSLGDDEALLITGLFAAPAVLAVLVFLMNLIGRGKFSYAMTIIFGILMASVDGFGLVILSDYYWQMGYDVLPTAFALPAASVLMLLFAVIGIVRDGKTAKAGGGKPAKSGKKAKAGKNTDEKVRVNKNDGTITGLTGAYTGAVIPLTSGIPMMIGRDPSVCSIVLEAETVSKCHCQILFNAANGLYAVTDLSANGTFDAAMNRLPFNTAMPMMPGSVIQIGQTCDQFRLG